MLTGADGVFCAGADLKAVASGSNTPALQPDGNGPLGCTRMLLSKPVIAAVEGFAVAGGLELALWCDLRVAAEDAVFGVYCRRWGVPLVDGGTIRLSRLIGHSHALDLILTGRGVSGEEARAMGLANRITPAGDALEGAMKLAGSLIAFPQLCMRKRQALVLPAMGLVPRRSAARGNPPGPRSDRFRRNRPGCVPLRGGQGPARGFRVDLGGEARFSRSREPALNAFGRIRIMRAASGPP